MEEKRRDEMDYSFALKKVVSINYDLLLNN